MRNSMVAILGVAAAMLANTGNAQMEGANPPDGPMQGLMRAPSRPAERFVAFYDLNHDGKVTREEMDRADAKRFAAAAHGAPSMSPEQFQAMNAQAVQQHSAQMFRRLDWNGDGTLSLEEYAAPMRVRFQTLDRDGRGTESCRPGVRDPSLRPANRGFASAGKARFCADNDLNRDGVVTHAEFDRATAARFRGLTGGAAAMTQAQFAAEALKHYRESSSRLFARFDTNRDGKLSLAEFSAPGRKQFARMDSNRDGAVSQGEIAHKRIAFGPKAKSG